MRIARGIGEALLSAGALALLAGGASAQEAPDKTARPSIRVTAEATVSAKPDRARIDIGVVTQAPAAQAAATRNAQQLEAVLAALRRALGPTADLKTTSYSLVPDYRAPGPGLTPAIVGYTATNVIQAETDNLAEVGKVIDVAMQAGANSIRRLQFTLKDERAARAQALREAAINARAQAEALANALGLKIVRVLSAAEGGPVVVRPILGAAMAGRAEALAAATPVEPGTIDVHATVTLVVEVAP